MDKNKICDNCGKCLGKDDYEVRSIQVDEILEDSEEYVDEEGEVLESISADSQEGFEEEGMELIDDIEGLRDLLENKEHLEKYTVEEFPGFIRFKNVK